MRWGSVRTGAQALVIAAVGVLAMGGAAVAAPKGDQGPPEHAQGNGPPAQEEPATQQAPAATPNGKARGKANGQAKQAAPETQTPSGGDAHGKSGGGHAKARGEGHRRSGGGNESGNQERGSSHAKAGKVTICHATGSETNPYVQITISANAVHAHERHQDGRDIIPAPAAGCPGGSSQPGGGHENGKEHGKVTICHATGSETNPYVEITIDEHALPAHLSHQHGEDIYPVPAGGCPSTEIPAGVGNPPSGIVSPPGGEPAGGDELASGESPAGESPAGEVRSVSDQGESTPEDDDAGVAGANQGGGDEADETREATGTSLPFTGLGLGLLAAIGALLALAGAHLRRRTA